MTCTTAARGNGHLLRLLAGALTLVIASVPAFAESYGRRLTSPVASPGVARLQVRDRAAAARSSVVGQYGNPFNAYLRQPFGVLPRRLAHLPVLLDNPNKPFSYYRNNWAALGVFGGVENTMIDPKGDLRTDFGTLLFYIGDELAPLNQRIETWRDGWLPIGESSTTSRGVTYGFEYFDGTVAGVSKIAVKRTYGVKAHRVTARGRVDNMVTFIRVTLRNRTAVAQTAQFGVALGARTIPHPAFRGPKRPAMSRFDRAHLDVAGDGKLLMVVSASPTRMVKRGAGTILVYSVKLAPNAEYSVVLKLPYWVAQLRDRTALATADYTTMRNETEKFWTAELSHTGVSIPESKVEDTYKASIVALLDDALNIVGNHWFFTGNPTVYKHFYMRDSAFHVDALLKAGLPGVVRHVLDDYRAWQRDDGRYVYAATPGEYDSNGEALWSFGRYYQVTHDADFARRMLPSVKRSMAWQWRYRRNNWSTAGGLYPINEIPDDEEVKGHIVGFNLWAIAGAKAAVSLARGAGDRADALLWAGRVKAYKRILERKLRPEFDQLGVVSPAVEGIRATGLTEGGYGGAPVAGWYGDVYGLDWGNMQLVWPGEVFRPSSELVQSSLSVWERKMFEGLMGYPQGGDESFLHSYAPISILEAYVRGGDQLRAVRYLYAELTHASAMGMASEGINAATRWGWDAASYTLPHNEFSAEYVSATRDMLAYGTYGGVLHLMNVYSPDWVRPSQRISFSGPTRFGHTAFNALIRSNGIVIRVTPPTRNPPREVVIRIPAGYELDGGTTVDDIGKSSRGRTKIGSRQITIYGPSKPFTVRVRWHVLSQSPAYSYRRAVIDLIADYQKMTSPTSVSVQRLTVTATKDYSGAEGCVGKHAGAPYIVTALINNGGGAGRLPDPDVTLYVDGQPAAQNRTILARGIGFNTPRRIVSFRHHDEGIITVRFRVELTPGIQHQLGVGVGAMPATLTHVRPHASRNCSAGVSGTVAR